MTLLEGYLVINTTAPELGPAKLLSLNQGYATITYMESLAQWRESQVPVAQLKRVNPWPQNRVYVRNHGIGWRTGRITALRTDPTEGFEVRFPNGVEQLVEEQALFLRAEGNVLPMEVLKLHGHETAFFFERRWPLMEILTCQRAAAQGLPALLSCSVDLRDHQVETARQVLHDSVQRYLLADEVGLGKTIEAGLIIRQTLMDAPTSRVTCLVPPHLVAQWERELQRRFYLKDFPQANVQVLPYTTQVFPESDLVVVDEAHRVTVGAFATGKDHDAYRRLAAWCHRSPKLLLLSATPASSDELGFLAMLHLLDPQVYHLEDAEAFALRVRERERIGLMFYALQPDMPASLMHEPMEDVRALFPRDRQVQELVDAWRAVPDDERHDVERTRLLHRLRLHVSETYRLHRRMIRHRRATHADALVRGREPGAPILVSSPGTHLAWEAFERFREALGVHAEAGPDELELATRALQDLLEGAMAGHVAWHEAVQDLCADPEVCAVQDVHEALVEMQRFLPASDHELIVALERHARQGGRKMVIFTLSAAQANWVYEQLRLRLGSPRVACTTGGDAALRQFQQQVDCQVFVADAGSEEGLNLQCADELLHLDLPTNPNRLEQRLGRLDRYGRGRPIVSRLVIRADWPEVVREYGRWYDMLGIHATSVASLQFMLEDLRREMLGQVLRGPQALKDWTSGLPVRLEEEQARVEQSELLDAIQEGASERLPRMMDQLFEVEAASFEKAFSDWVIDALKFQPVYEDKIVSFKFSDRKTLVAWEDIRRAFRGTLQRLSTFSRAAAQRDGTHLLRLGEPFVDAMSAYLERDDRGRSYAFWRADPTWNDDDLVAFGLHFVVEAGLDQARSAARSAGLDEQAVRRRLQGLLGPQTRTVYVDQHGQPLSELASAALQPRFRQRADYNLSQDRLFALTELLPEGEWLRACDRVMAAATAAMQADNYLRTHIEEAFVMAQETLQTQWNQLHLRYATGQPDVNAVDLEQEAALHAAMLEGIRVPHYRLDAVGVRVLSCRNPFL